MAFFGSACVSLSHHRGGCHARTDKPNATPLLLQPAPGWSNLCRHCPDRPGLAGMCALLVPPHRQGRQTEKTVYQRQPRGLLQTFPWLVRYVLLRLRLQHPCWGPSRLRFHLSQRPSLDGYRLPCLASIGSYLHHWPRFRRPLRSPSLVKRPNAPTQVHERWQADFKVGIVGDDGHLMTLTSVRDVVSGATIGAYLTPVKRMGCRPQALTFVQVRAALRRCFAQWRTLPDQVQTDNEAVFRGRSGENVPSPFTLWLKGLRIEHIPIRPGKPTDNAEIERQQRTVNDYALVGRNQHNNTDQEALDQAVHELNYALPSRRPAVAVTHRWSPIRTCFSHVVSMRRN